MTLFTVIGYYQSDGLLLLRIQVGGIAESGDFI